MIDTTQADRTKGLERAFTKTILVVDDELHIREVVQACLEVVEEWQVILAASGQEGLLKARTTQPDVILLDVMMPEMDGLTFLRTLRGDGAIAAIPVILLTAKTQFADANGVSVLGLPYTIAKPFNPLILPNQIATALGWNL